MGVREISRFFRGVSPLGKHPAIPAGAAEHEVAREMHRRICDQRIDGDERIRLMQQLNRRTSPTPIRQDMPVSLISARSEVVEPGRLENN